MNNAFTKMMNSPRHRQPYAVTSALCALIIGASMVTVTGCTQDNNAELPPIKSASMRKPPPVGSVKDVQPTVAELEASLAKIKSNPKLDAGKKAMGIGMIEGQIKALKSKQKP